MKKLLTVLCLVLALCISFGAVVADEVPVVEEPVVEEALVAEEPVVEAVAAEEPVAEEPVAEEPVAEEPVAEEPVAEEPVAEEPVVEAVAAEEPVVEAVVAEEPVVEAVADEDDEEHKEHKDHVFDFGDPDTEPEGRQGKVLFWPSMTRAVGRVRYYCINSWEYINWDGVLPFAGNDFEDETLNPKHVYPEKDGKVITKMTEDEAIAWAAEEENAPFVKELVLPTCTEDGYLEVYCGFHYEDPDFTYFHWEEAKVAPNKPLWTAWKGACNETHKIKIEKLGHLMSNDKKVCDPAQYWHEPAATCDSEGTGYPYCMRPGCGYIDYGHPVTLEKEEHIWGWLIEHHEGWDEVRYNTETVKEPDCITKGLVECVCIKCGAVRPYGKATWEDEDHNIINDEWTLEMATLPEDVEFGHDFGDWIRDPDTYIAPTCSTEGHEDLIRLCKRCLIAKEKVETIIAATPHHNHPEICIVKTGNNTDPTCEENGTIEYQCTACGDLWYEKVAKLGHDWTAWECVVAYNEDGKDTPAYWYRQCKRCGTHEDKLLDNDSDPNKVKDGLVEEGGRLRWYNDGVPSTANGLTYIPQELDWYMLEGGYVDEEYNDFARKFDRDWIVKNGKLDSLNDGIVEYGGSYFAVSEGMRWTEWTGMWWKDNVAYLLSAGEWLKKYNGRYTDASGVNILIKDGIQDMVSTTWTNDAGVTYPVINGIIQM